MADEKLIRESEMREAELNAEKSQVEQELEAMKPVAPDPNAPPKNIFGKMREMFDKYQDNNKVNRMAKEQLKKEYDEKISQARKDRKLEENKARFEAKLARAKMTRQERAADTQQKIGRFTDKLSKGLGGASANSFVNLAGNSLDRQLGVGSGRQGGDPFSSDKVSRMLGKSPEGNKRYVASTPNKTFDASRLMGYMSSGQAHKVDVVGTLGRVPKRKEYGSAYGVSPIRNVVPEFGKSPKVDSAKYLPKTDFGGNLDKFLRATNKKEKKGKIIDMEPQEKESSAAKIKRMLG